MAMHHPFTAPMDECIRLSGVGSRAASSAKAYDIVLNGIELASGSIRISRSRSCRRGCSQPSGAHAMKRPRQKFGYPDRRFPVRRAAARRHGLRAGSLGHADARLRLHRATWWPTPKVQNTSDLMTDCPSQVDPAQLDELGIRLAVSNDPS